MRISDWSSDVCSSDLELAEAADRDFVTLGRGVGDNGKDGVDGLAGVGLAEIQRCGDAVRQFGMIHLGTLLYLHGRWPGGKQLYGKVLSAAIVRHPRGPRLPRCSHLPTPDMRSTATGPLRIALGTQLPRHQREQCRRRKT